jgi:TRAP-type transport system periplasmic protein
MMLMKRHTSRRFFLGGLGVLAAPIGSPLPSRAADSEKYTMRLGSFEPPTAYQPQTALRFAAAVEQRSNGQLKIEVYPNGQLISQSAVNDALINGVLDFATEPTAVLISMLPQYQVLDMPFLFKNIASAARILDGPIGEELFAALLPKGIIGFTWLSTAFKTLETASKAVTVPDDIKGLRIRIVGGGIFPATYQALGAIPVTIDFSETLTALTQHTIDGLDFSLDSFTSGKLYTAAKQVSMLNHFLQKDVLVGSRRKIEALPVALQNILKEEGRAVGSYARTLVAQREAATIQTLRANGVTFVEKPNIAAFRKAVEPVYTQYRPRLGELLDRINRAAQAT